MATVVPEGTPVSHRARTSRTSMLAYVRQLFGYDFFISYHRAEAAGSDANNPSGYVAALERELRRLDYTCFLDTDIIESGKDFRAEIDKGLKRSRKLILIGTKHALERTEVKRELQMFVDRQHKFDNVLVINVGGALVTQGTPFEKQLDLDNNDYIHEDADGVIKAVPSQSAVTKIAAHGTQVRVNQILRFAVGGIVVVLLSLTAWALLEQRRAIANARNAEERRREAIEVVRQVVHSIDEDLEPVAGAVTPASQTLREACDQLDDIVEASTADEGAKLAQAECNIVRGHLLARTDARGANDEYRGALKKLRELRQHSQWYAGDNRNNAERVSADALEGLALLTDDADEKDRLRREAVELRRGLVERNRDNCDYALALAGSLLRRGQAIEARKPHGANQAKRTSETSNAERYVAEGAEIVQKWARLADDGVKCTRPGELEYRRADAILEAHRRKVKAIQTQGERPAADIERVRAALNEAMKRATVASEAAPSNFRYATLAAEARVLLGDITRHQAMAQWRRLGAPAPCPKEITSRFIEWAGFYEPAVSLFRRFYAQDDADMKFRRLLGVALARLGYARFFLWRCLGAAEIGEDAAKLTSEALRISHENVGLDPNGAREACRTALGFVQNVWKLCAGPRAGDNAAMCEALRAARPACLMPTADRGCCEYEEP